MSVMVNGGRLDVTQKLSEERASLQAQHGAGKAGAKALAVEVAAKEADIKTVSFFLVLI